MELADIIEKALTEQVGNTTLTQQQIKEFTREIVKQIEINPDLRTLPANQLFDKVQTTIQLVFANDHGSISNAAQYVVQVLISQVIDDPQINIPQRFQSPEFCPYPGLRAFTEYEQSIFYGREIELSQFENCCDESVIAITGASGVGKSSFLQAAVIPKIKQLFGENVLILPFRATTSVDLLTEFASLLSSVTKKPTQAIRSAIEKSKSAVFDLLQSLRTTSDQRIFLIVDQFEEIFVAEDKNQQRKCLLENLLYIDSHSSSGLLSVILTSRKNFMEHPDYTTHPRLVQVIEKTAINLDALNIESLRQAIEKPLSAFNSYHQQNLHFQLGLVDIIVADFRNRSISLPLVQYLLRLLWLDKHQLSHFAYAALGKLDRVLDRHATEIYDMFSDDQKPNVDGVLLSLVRLGLEGEYTRKRIRFDQVISTSTDELIVRRLTSENSRIISEQIIDDGRYLELTHEVILREWSLLRNLIHANRERLKLREQLLVNAELWFASKTALLPQGNSGYLYQGALYQHAKKYIAQQKYAYDSDARIVACLLASQRRRRRNFLSVVSVVSIVAAVVAIAIGILQRRAQDESQRADANATAQVIAQTQADLNATAQAVAEQQANMNATAQAVAEQQAQINENARATEAAKRASAQTETENQKKFNLSRSIAAVSLDLLNKGNTEAALLVALEANNKAHSFEAEDSLRQAFSVPYKDSGTNLPTNLSMVTDINFSPNGKKFVVAGAQNMHGAAEIWNLETGTRIAVAAEEKDYLMTAKFVTDNEILTHDATGNMSIFSAEDGKYMRAFRSDVAIYAPNSELSVPTAARLSIRRRFGQDNNLLIQSVYVPSEDIAHHVTSVIDTSTGLGVLGSFANERTEVLDVRELNNPQALQLLRVDEDNTVNISTFNTISGVVSESIILEKSISSKPESGIISNLGKIAAYSDNNGNIRVYETSNGQLIHNLKGDAYPIVNWEFSLDDSWLIAQSAMQTIMVWNLSENNETPIFTFTNKGVSNSGTEITRIEAGSAVAISPDKKWFGGLLDGEIHLWNSKILDSEPFLPEGYVFNGFIGDKNSLVISQWKQGAWDYYSYSQSDKQLTPISDLSIRIVENPCDWNNPLLSPDGNWLLVSDLLKVQVKDITSGKTISIMKDPEIGGGAWWANDSKTLVMRPIPQLGFNFSLWDALTGKKITALDAGGFPYHAVLSPDGRLVAGSSSALDIKIWDLYSYRLVRTIKDLESPPTTWRFDTMNDFVNSIQFSPDSNRILVADQSAIPKLFDVDSNDSIVQFEGHTAAVHSACFSPDGKYVITGAEDNTVRLWRSEKGEPISLVRGFDRGVFSPDGNQFVAYRAPTFSDGQLNLKGTQIHLYPSNYQDLLTLAKARVFRQLTCEERVQYLQEHLSCS